MLGLDNEVICVMDTPHGLEWYRITFAPGECHLWPYYPQPIYMEVATGLLSVLKRKVWVGGCIDHYHYVNGHLQYNFVYIHECLSKLVAHIYECKYCQEWAMN